MSTKPKRTTTGAKDVSNNNAPYYPSTQYGYTLPPYDNSQYIDPYMYSPPSYNNSDFLYYPVDKYGHIVGPATNFPPIVNQPQSRYNPYSNSMSNISTYGSYVHPPTRERMVYDDYYSPRHTHLHHSYETSRRETLPPIHPLATTRPISSYDDYEHPQFIVNDLTGRDSSSPRLSQRTAVEKIRHYDKLRKSYY